MEASVATREPQIIIHSSSQLSLLSQVQYTAKVTVSNRPHKAKAATDVRLHPSPLLLSVSNFGKWEVLC